MSNPFKLLDPVIFTSNNDGLNLGIVIKVQPTYIECYPIYFCLDLDRFKEVLTCRKLSFHATRKMLSSQLVVPISKDTIEYLKAEKHFKLAYEFFSKILYINKNNLQDVS